MSVPEQLDTTLQLNQIAISLQGKELISVSASLGEGEVLTVMGASGTGKSTLLAFVGGFLDPAFAASGDVILNGQNITDLPAEHRQVGILFQDPLLFPHMSVGGNLLFAVPQDIKNAKERKAIVTTALEDAGLNGYFDRDPATLSGGQKARVALMRVLLAKPKALLLDEPFSKLDAGRRDHIRTFVFNEAKQCKLPVLLVTHDQADAEAAGGRLFILPEGQ
jgi:putative thiamine transport system ATP-binding protein